MLVTFLVIRVTLFLYHVIYLPHDIDVYIWSISSMPIWLSLLSSILTVCDDLYSRHTIKTVCAHLITYDYHGNLHYDDNNVAGNNVKFAIVICLCYFCCMWSLPNTFVPALRLCRVSLLPLFFFFRGIHNSSMTIPILRSANNLPPARLKSLRVCRWIWEYICRIYY
jgi:hypothetical protein